MVDTASQNPPTAQGTSPARRLRIALAHDWICGLRGGEWVLDQLARLVAAEHEPAGLFVMFDDGRGLTPAVDAWPRVVSRVGRLPMADRLRRWMLPLYPRAVGELSGMLEAQHRRCAIDLLISTSSAAIKGLRPPRGVPHLCYCHSPARYVWSRTDEYAGGLRGVGLSLLGPRFRAWDVASAANVTQFVANSEHTARQVRAHYRREAVVVYPPLRPQFLDVAPAASTEPRPWLVVSALEPYKRVDLAVRAAAEAGHELVVIGVGSQRRRLERSAGPTVRFLGRVPESELLRWYARARLLIFPQVEDFGLAAVEAQACGLPVVARRDGGALESVVEGVTGRFFAEPTVASLLQAIRSCPDHCAQACRENALRFSPDRFDAAVRAQITTLVAGACRAG